MRFTVSNALMTPALGAALAAPAAAQGKPSIAIMPTQYFSADADSAKNVTSGLASQWERQGYTLIGQDKADAQFQTMSLSPSTNYADRVAVKFGRAVGADLVAYPRLLAVGIPAADATGFMAPNAVLHLRVINVHTNRVIYFRQVAYEFDAKPLADLPRGEITQTVAARTAADATRMYFQRVAEAARKCVDVRAAPSANGLRAKSQGQRARGKS